MWDYFILVLNVTGSYLVPIPADDSLDNSWYLSLSWKSQVRTFFNKSMICYLPYPFPSTVNTADSEDPIAVSCW
jgi:hypothetical protein